MNENEFDDLIEHVRIFSRLFAGAYEEVVGEELNVESVIRHYPLLALGIAAGAGAAGGWFIGRRGQKQLPPPPPPPQSNPLSQLERFIPEGLDRVRDLIPETLAEEAANSARTWVEEVLEPSIKEGLHIAAENVEQTRFGMFIRESLRRLEGGDEHQLPDPD